MMIILPIKINFYKKDKKNEKIFDLVKSTIILTNEKKLASMYVNQYHSIAEFNIIETQDNRCSDYDMIMILKNTVQNIYPNTISSIYSLKLLFSKTLNKHYAYPVFPVDVSLKIDRNGSIVKYYDCGNDVHDGYTKSILIRMQIDLKKIDRLWNAINLLEKVLLEEQSGILKRGLRLLAFYMIRFTIWGDFYIWNRRNYPYYEKRLEEELHMTYSDNEITDAIDIYGVLYKSMIEPCSSI